MQEGGIMRRMRKLAVAVIVMSGCSGPPANEPQQNEVPTDAVSATATPAVPVSAESSNVSPIFSVPRRNSYLQLAVTEAGFDPAGPAPPPGQRYYTVGLRGNSVSRADFVLEVVPFMFAQNDRGCLARADPEANWLKRPMGSTAVFSALKPTEGQVSFLVPDDTQRIRVLIAPASGDALVAPAGEDFQPSWPAPVRTVEDGSTLRVSVLPSPDPPPALPAPADGRENLVLDLVVENLKSTQGIEFTTSQQLRVVDSAGTFIQPSALTKKIGCRLDDGDVIPPASARRFLVAYEVPAENEMKLQYRGFELDEATVDIH
jgi:hypothetical protein